MIPTERDDNQIDSLEALDEEARLQDRGTADSAEEAAAEGLAYSPPEQAPVVPGGAADAQAADLQVPDAVLLEDVLVALADNPATENLGLRARVSDGTVTLRGYVPASADAEEACATVLSVSGVDAVEDELDAGHRDAPECDD